MKKAFIISMALVLIFAVTGVTLSAQEEAVDTKALIERYEENILELKTEVREVKTEVTEIRQSQEEEANDWKDWVGLGLGILILVLTTVFGIKIPGWVIDLINKNKNNVT
jgi:hypothetical protein